MNENFSELKKGMETLLKEIMNNKYQLNKQKILEKQTYMPIRKANLNN